MPDPADYGNERAAEFIEAILEGHEAAQANRSRLSALFCLDCGEPISEERQRKAVGCDRCTDCQTEHDKEGKRK